MTLLGRCRLVAGRAAYQFSVQAIGRGKPGVIEAVAAGETIAVGKVVVDPGRREILVGHLLAYEGEDAGVAAAQQPRVRERVKSEVARDRWPVILSHCSFDYMKAHAGKIAPLGGAFWDGSGEAFINKGTNGRWKDVLTAEDNRRYEQVAREKLGEDCAKWLATGEM